MSGCQAYADRSGTALCGWPSIATVVSICVHEHVGERRYCGGCAVELQRRDPAGLGCRHCDEGARQPHWCHAQAEIRWDSGDITRADGSGWVAQPAITSTRRGHL